MYYPGLPRQARARGARGLELGAQVAVVLNDAVVDDCDPPRLIEMRVGIGLGDFDFFANER